MWKDFVFEPPRKNKGMVHMHDWTHPNQKEPRTKYDPINDLNQKVLNKLQYEGEEQGLYHPMYHQSIKLRNNEMIDVFADRDNGIRIDPHTQSINMFCNDYKLHIHNQTSWLTGYKKEHIHGDSLAKIHGQLWRHSYGNMGFVTERNWNQEVKGSQHNVVYKDDNQTVDGNQTIRVGKDQRQQVEGDQYESIMGNQYNQIHGNQKETIHGNQTIIVKGNVNLQVEGNVNSQINGHLSQRVSGNVGLYVDGSIYARAIGNMTAVTDSDLYVRASGNATVESHGDATIDVGGAFKVDAGSVDIRAKGSVTLDGSRVDVGL